MTWETVQQDPLKLVPIQQRTFKVVDARELLTKEIPPVEFMFKNERFACGAFYLLDGLSRAGKGVFSSAFSVSLATGNPLCASLSPMKPRRVLAVTVEDTERRMQSRTAAFLHGQKIPAEALGDRLQFVIRPEGGLRLNDAGTMASLREAAKKVGPEVIVLDNLHRMLDGSEIDDEAIRPAMEAADSLRDEFGASVFLVHHWGKSTDTKASVHRSRGSSAIPGYVDAHLTITREKDEPIIKAELHDGRDEENFSVRLRLDREGQAWTYSEIPEGDHPALDGTRSEVLRSFEQIHKESKAGVPAVAIEARTSLSSRVVQEQLKVLMHLGRVHRKGKARAVLYFPGRESRGGLIEPPAQSSVEREV